MRYFVNTANNNKYMADGESASFLAERYMEISKEKYDELEDIF